MLTFAHSWLFLLLPLPLLVRWLLPRRIPFFRLGFQHSKG